MTAQDPARTMFDLASVYRDHRAYVRACLVSCRVPAPSLDDAIQDVFVVLFRRADAYDATRGTLRAWLFGISLRVARQHRRRAGRPELTTESLRADDAVDDPERYVARLRATEIAREILDTLPREQLSVLVLAEIEGLTGPEIACSLQLPLGTVHSRLSRARRRLTSEVRRKQRDEGVEARPWFAVLALRARDGVRTRPHLATAAFASLRTLLVVAGLAVVATLLWLVRSEIDRPGEQATAAAAEDPSSAAQPQPIPPVSASRASESPSIRTSSISGAAYNEAGAAVRGAMVCAWLEAKDPLAAEHPPPRCQPTDAGGHYEIRNLMPARYRVTATAANMRPGQHDTGSRVVFFPLGRDEQRTNVDITLAGGGVLLRGSVSDVTGGPVSDAVVMARDRSIGSALADGSWGPTPPVLARTGEDGEFSMWIVPGDIKLIANADGYAQAETYAIAPGLTATLMMTPESVVSGRVVDAISGAPVVGAAVRVGGEGPDRLGARTSFSDAEGAFRIAGLQPGRYRPRASALGKVGNSDASVAVGLGETVDDLTVKLRSVPTVSGKIVGPAEVGCPGGMAVLNSSETGETFAVIASSGGEVLFEAVPAGVYDVLVACHGLTRAGPPPRLMVAGADVADQVWNVVAGVAITGIVRGPDGIAAANIWVAGYSTSAGASMIPLSARTDEHGAFVLPGAAPGSYNLSASARGTGTATLPNVQVADTDVAVDLALPATRAVEGLVVDSTGAAQAGVTVIMRAQRVRTTTLDDGTFRVEGIAPGSHEVTAQRALADESQAATAVVTADADAHVELVLPALSKTIRGVVHSEDGGPVADAIVTALADDTIAQRGRDAGMRQLRHLAGFGRGRAPTLTDAHGRFEIAVSDGGPFTLMAQRRGGGDAWRGGVAVGADVHLQIPALASMAGNITTTDGAAVSGLRIRLREAQSGAVLVEPFGDGNGSFRFDDLAAGSYTMVAEAREGRLRTTVKLDAGDERSDLALAVVANVSVTGTVVDITTGAPVEGMLVVLGPQDEEIDHFATKAERATVFGKEGHRTDKDGRFALSDVPPGALRVMVLPAKLGEGPYGRAIFAMSAVGTSPVNELDPIYIAPMPVAAQGMRLTPAGLIIDQRGPWCVATPKLKGVAPGSAAARAGLVAGDEIVKIGGHDVTGRNCHLAQRLSSLTSDAGLTVTLRDGRSLTLEPSTRG